MDNFEDHLVLRVQETISVGEAFKESERTLKAAMDRLGDDEVKWEMVKHLADRFEKLGAKHEALTVMCERNFNRDFAVEEFKEMTKEKSSLAKEIHKVMDELDENK